MNVIAPRPESSMVLAAYEAVRGRFSGDLARRDAAAEILRRNGLPTRRQEAWKYTDLRALNGFSITLSMPPVSFATARRLLDQLRLEALNDEDRLVFVNGRLDRELSRMPTAIRIVQGPADGGLADPEREPMVALNTMLAGDGAALHVPAGIDAGRLLLISLAVGTETGPDNSCLSIHPRISLSLEADARLSLLEIASGEGVYLNNPVLEIQLASHASLTHVLVQDEAPTGLHFSTVYVMAAKSAAYESFSLALGGRVARHEVHATLFGSGAEIQVNGAQLLTAHQHADLTSVITHAAPGCNSRQTVKNVLSGKSRAVFQGKIVVAREAQRTDGFQMNQSLLLSDTAETDSKPELEIYADDVKCSHGATVGALDEDQLFYLRSRGVPAHEAQAMLVRAFIADALGLIGDELFRDFLSQSVERRWESTSRAASDGSAA